ncbi:MAG: macro domain-containing protein [Oscillospiraceae bacterium]|nr:macro domain-containing protein [Oscillospiraceae bacterium]
MTFNEVRGDLFAYEGTGESTLVHCIASDFALGAGIAKVFAKMGVKRELCEKYPKEWNGRGYCLMTDTNGVKTANLVTKQSSFGKPTLETLKQALEDFRDKAEDIHRIAMPKIGCGLDKLKWEDVRELIQEVFADTDKVITVYYL